MENVNYIFFNITMQKLFAANKNTFVKASVCKIWAVNRSIMNQECGYITDGAGTQTQDGAAAP